MQIDVWEGTKRAVKQLETVQMAAAKNVLQEVLKYHDDYNIVPRAELGR